MSATTVREQVHEKLAEVLTAALPSLFPGIKIYRNRDAEMQSFPALNLIDGNQERVTPESTGFNEYTLTVPLEGFVQAEEPAELGPAMNELYGQTIKTLMADRRLGGLAIDMAEGFLTVDIGRRANQKPVAGFSVDIEVKFWTAEDDPYELGPAV